MRGLIFANFANLNKIAKINSRKNLFPQKFVPAKISTFKVYIYMLMFHSDNAFLIYALAAKFLQQLEMSYGDSNR